LLGGNFIFIIKEENKMKLEKNRTNWTMVDDEGKINEDQEFIARVLLAEGDIVMQKLSQREDKRRKSK
jgi:hypothetical protein